MSGFPPVLILAGGLGTRIAELSGKLPKSLLPVKGKPFIAHQLLLLADRGVQDVLLCVGHQSEAIRKYVGSGRQFGVNVQYSFDGEVLLGTGGSVLKASQLVSSPFAVLYGDSYLDIDYAPVYQSYLDSGKKALMTVFCNDNKWIPSNMLLRDGSIIAYDKSNPSPLMKHVDFGLSIYAREAFLQMPNKAFDLSLVVQHLIGQGQLAGYESKQRFFEIGSKEGVQELEEYLGTAT